jgi:hypothetical protein
VVIEEAYPVDAQQREKMRFLDADGPTSFLAAHEARYHTLRSERTRIASADALALVVKDKYGRWGYSGLRSYWDDFSQHALHDLETVRESARAFRQAVR